MLELTNFNLGFSMKKQVRALKRLDQWVHSVVNLPNSMDCNSEIIWSMFLITFDISSTIFYLKDLLLSWLIQLLIFVCIISIRAHLCLKIVNLIYEVFRYMENLEIQRLKELLQTANFQICQNAKMQPCQRWIYWDMIYKGVDNSD